MGTKTPERDHTLPEIQEDTLPQERIDDTDSTATNSSDEFDWSDDEEDDKAQLQVRTKRGRRLWLAFVKLARPIRVVLVSLVGVAISVTPLLVVDLRFPQNPAKTQVHVWSLWLTIIWAASCITYLVVDLIPRFVIKVTWFCGGKTERLKFQVELIMAVMPWLKLLLDIAWALIALSVLRAVYTPQGTYWTIISRVIQVLLAAAIILFVEKLFLNFVAINFHQKALADRLEENRLGLKALDCLSKAHPVASKKHPYHKRGHKKITSVATIDLATLHQGEQQDDTINISTTRGHHTTSANDSTMFPSKSSPELQPKRRTKKVTSVIVDQVGEAIGQFALKNKFHKQGGLDSARKLARKLFSVLSDVKLAKSHLVVEDFYPYFRSTSEAHDAFALFDKDGNGDISKREMREAVQRIYRERKSLIAGLKDVDSIVAKLDGVLLSVALLAIIFVALLVFNRNNTLSSLVPLATIILGFSFIFGHSAQVLFESLIFIFSTHVFDVGDLVMIDDQVLFVKEFGLFSTTFRRVDGQEVIAPNALLASTKLVHNLRRSKSMWETTTLTVGYDTSMEVIESLKSKINTYVSANSREWSGFTLNIDKMEYQNAISLLVAMEHRPNWQDWGGRWTRRTAFMRHLKTVLEELDIRYTMPVQPVLLPKDLSSLPMSLLSSLEAFQSQDAFSPHAVHPFASTAPDACVLLQDLINATDQVSRSLSICDSSIPWSNTKVVSLLRQHSSIEFSAFSSVKNNRHLIDTLRDRSGIHYGENIPLHLASIPDWCINQLGTWGTSVGMETFIDGREGGATVVLGGKVLVIDIDFAIELDEQLNRRLKVVNIKTSNALVSGNSHPSTSTMLDMFLADNIQKYCAEMQKTEDLRDSGLAATIRKNILSQLRYLVLLDGLASRKDDGGIRWFTDIDELYPTLNGVARGEAVFVASSLFLPKAPLDIFLLRSHALPLPYLIIPSMSFLTYLSPLAYLSLLHISKGQEQETDDSFPPLDLTLPQLRSHLTSLNKGVTIATLSLEKLSEAHLYPSSMAMPNVTTRPTFPLMPAVSELDHNFPQFGDNFSVAVDSHDSNAFSGPYTWVLDFTHGGKRPGVVTSQSRMKEIELVVNPLGGVDSSLNGVSEMLSFSTVGWIDLLLNPGATMSPERYTALYKSPNSLHPPLQLRLMPPEEPGFLLERVPVHSMKEVWGILEVVREQCWLNEILLSCNWTTEGAQQAEEEKNIQDDSVATEDDLQAVLSGTFTPYRIPVNVTIPFGNATDNLFGPAELDFPPPSRPKIVMTSPERPPISGLVEITVTHDETRPRGISLEIQGAMGSDLKPADLEEICRRGGTLGLPGRVWANGYGLTV